MTDTQERQAPTSAAPAPRVAYEPGLDGLRAVALLSIYVVHANVGLAPGGFLAVSTFFTLSGFLITALLSSEHRRNGRIDLMAFWTRRARRLLPASLLAIVLIGAATLVLGDASQVDHLRGDVIGALTYVANWRFLLAGTTYAGEFGGQSPLLHFWSLAIEEQFYLVFPLLAIAAFTLARRWRGAAAAVLGAGVAASLVAGVVGASGDGAVDKLYFRTDIRAGELLVGALFGLWWAERGRRLADATRGRLRMLGAVALVAMVSLIATSDYHDRFWYRGGLIAYSLVTVAVILAAVEAAGPVRRALAWGPLVTVGSVSYGAYLVHWPLFMWLFTKTSMPGAARLVVGTVVSIAVALVSHRLVELPIRERRAWRTPALLGAAAVLVVVAVVIGVTAPSTARNTEVPLERAAESVADHLSFTAAKPGEAPTVGLFGDSTALITSLGLAKFDDTDRTIREGPGWSGLGCTINAPADFKTGKGEVRSSPTCDGWLEKWRHASATNHLDVAWVMFGPWEVKEMRLVGETTWRTIGEPAQDAVVERRLAEGLDALVATTPLVVIATAPYIEPGRIDGRSPATEQPDADHARMDRLNAIIRRVAARYPKVAVADLAGWLDASGQDRRLRPDGVHLTDATALELGPRFAATVIDVTRAAGGKAAPAQTDPAAFPVLQYAVG